MIEYNVDSRGCHLISLSIVLWLLGPLMEFFASQLQGVFHGQFFVLVCGTPKRRIVFRS